MSLHLINPLSSITTSASRISRNILLSKGQELSSGLKDPENNITDHMIGSKLKNSSKLMSAVKLNSINAINITKQAEDGLEHIANSIKTIKELMVTASSTNDASTINSLNARYKSEVVGLIQYIDQAKFNDTNLFNGELQDLKVRVGEEFNHNITVSIPKLLVSYEDLGIEKIDKHIKQKEKLIEIGNDIKNITNNIKDLENKIDTQKKQKKQCTLFKLQKYESEEKLLIELKNGESLKEELDKLDLLYEEDKNELEKNLTEALLKIEELNNLKQGLHDAINIKKGELDLGLQKLEKKKKENLESFIENDDLLTKEIAEKEKESLEIKDMISQTKKERGLNKSKLEKVSQEIGVLSAETENFQNQINSLKKEQEKALLKHSTLKKEVKNQASNLNQDKESIKKEISKAKNSIVKSKKKIETYQNELEKIPQQLDDKQKDKVKEENEIVDTKSRLFEIQDLQVQVPLKEELIKEELDKRYVRLDNINKNISTLGENLETYKGGILSEEAKIIQSTKKIEELTNNLNSQNEQINTNLELEKVSKELKTLNKNIDQLEQKVVLNNNKEQTLQTSKAEVFGLYNKNNDDISDLVNKLNSINSKVEDLEKGKKSIADDNIQSQLEEKLTKMKEDFALDNKDLLNKLSNIEKEIKLASVNKAQTESQLLELGQSYVDKSNKLNLGINKQQEFCSGLEKKILDLTKKIQAIAHSGVEDLKPLENELVELKNKKDELIEESLKIKYDIEDFTNFSNDILKKHGGLFIREELENSNLVDAHNIRQSEEMIDIGIERLFAIISNTNQTQSFLVNTSDKITSTINLLNEVSDDYLSTNYVEAAQQYKQALLSLRAQMSIRAQGEMIVNAILKRIES